MKTIIFSPHAEIKFSVLDFHGFHVERAVVEAVLTDPDRVDAGYRGRRVAQKAISAQHVLRVVFEDRPDALHVITFYPGRRDRYET